MKLFSTLAVAALLLTGSAALAETPQQEKYLCELQAGNCVKRADQIQRKMKKLDSDVKKGTKTYSADELKAIEQKLQEVEKMIDNLKAQQPKK